MRLRPLVAATAAVLFLQSPAIAAPAKPAPAKAKAATPAGGKPQPEFVRMIDRMVNEMVVGIDPKDHPGLALEKVAAVKYTPETAALLVKYFGTAKLLELQKVTNADGSLTYNYSTPLVDQKLDADQLKIAPLSGVMKVDKTGNAYTMNGAMEAASFKDKTTTLEMNKLVFASDRARGAHEFWTGDIWYTIDNVSVTPHGKPTAFSMGGIRSDIKARANGPTAEIGFEMIIQSIKVMGQDAGTVKMGFRATGLDLATLNKFNEEMRNAASAGDKVKVKVGDKQLSALFNNLALGGATMHLDELSWTYKGQSAVVKGSIGFPATAKGATMEETIKAVEGKLTVRVPMGLVREVTRAVVKNMPKGQQGQPMTEQQQEQQAATIGDIAVGKLLGGGFFRMEGEVLVSDIAYKDGKLTLNGVSMDLPKPAVAAPATPKQ